MSPLRIWLVGFGTVGRWLAGALDAQAARIARRYGVGVRVVGIASAHHGFIYDGGGLDLGSIRKAALLPDGHSLTSTGWGIGQPRSTACGPRRLIFWSGPLARRRMAARGLTHMREALQRGIPVATSNKWPDALDGVELAALARRRGIAFRAESTVMSGTPVLSALTEGLAEAVPGVSLRGVLNATANFILTMMTDGTPYDDALAAAQDAAWPNGMPPRTWTALTPRRR